MNTTLATITVGSHFFKLSRISHSIRPVIREFATRYVKYKLVKVPRGGGFKRVPDAVFGAATEDREEYRFHINQYQEFRDLFKERGYPDNIWNVETKSVPKGVEFDLRLNPGWVLRDYQVPVVEYLAAPKPISKIVEIQTGKGKSLSFMAGMARIKTRCAIMIRPMFIEKWVEDVQKVLNVKAHEVMVVKGGENLKALIQLALTDQLTDIKVIIISNKTYQGWLTHYEKYREDTLDQGYGCLPEDFFEVIGAGVRMVDEVHLDLHLQFKLDLYTNVATSIALSATFLSKDKFTEHVQSIMYPKPQRYQGGPLDKYITAIAAFYSIEDMRHIRTEERGGNMYSHNAFEKSIRRNPMQLKNYCRLIKHYVDDVYMKDYKPGERCIVFCSSVEMCAIMVNFLKREYSHLDIRRFTAVEPAENMTEPDIIVTTVLSGGTAHDVPRLKAIVQTISIDSIQSNIQAMGRLRNIEGMPLRFLYTVCTDVEKSMQYHFSKVELLKERAKVYQEVTSPFRV